ncbi:hypothetical protein [Wolbachia endosymbiont (group A) of Pogonocherus hispidulus]|uniref:hypothetical protein n=1 Tax=Wolbachia endosymbiont (group A) of Pogonocherus hispidulus TaxID=3066136 RepID=UPI0033409FA5
MSAPSKVRKVQLVKIQAKPSQQPGTNHYAAQGNERSKASGMDNAGYNESEGNESRNSR